MGPARPSVLSCLLSLLLSLSAIPHHMAGQHTQPSLEQLRAEVSGQPQSALAHAQLALALHELNYMLPDGGSRLPEAEREYRAALSLLSPSGAHASAYMHIQGNLGALLLSAEQPAAAIAELQAAINLGQQLQQQQQQQELAGVQEQLGGLLFNLGKALTSVGRLPEADDVYAEAAAVAFGRDFSSYGKALAAARSISPEAAHQAVQVGRAARSHFKKQSQLAFLKGLKLPDAAAANPLPSHQRGAWITNAQSVDLVWLHFALHKHYHTNKQYDLAWRYLELGNRIMATHVQYDATKEERNLAKIKGIFKQPFSSSGLQDRTPIFVVGMPRSGSTLVEQMLASHSQVYAAGEDTALAPLTMPINNALSQASILEHPHILAEFADQYLSRMRAKVPERWASKGTSRTTQRQQGSHQQADGAAASKDSASEAGAAPNATAANSNDSAGPLRIVDKMLRNLWLIGYIHMLLPRACIVHVVRHPMDVALSCFAQPFGYSTSALAWTWDLDAIASQLQMAWDLAQHWDQELPGKVHTVFYEELVERPESVASALLSACGLEWEPQVLQFQATDRPVQTASMVQVRQPLYKTSVARWKVYEQQLAPVRQSLEPLIAKYEQRLQQRLSGQTSEGVSAAAAAAAAGTTTAAAGIAAGSQGVQDTADVPKQDREASSPVRDEL